MNARKMIIIFITTFIQYIFIIYQKFYSLYIRIVRREHRTKVFCIGFSKTGTSSLDKALGILGYRNIHWLHAHIEPSTGWIEYIKKTPFDAFSDAPMYKPGLFKELDRIFPNSKFIFTVRDPISLAKSWDNYFSHVSWGINSPKDRKKLIEMYEKHKNDVYSYFKNKSHQVLTFNIVEGDSWYKLCSFLEKPIPKIPFPHKRKARYKNKHKSFLLKFI
jgi:hypothetical protein